MVRSPWICHCCLRRLRLSLLLRATPQIHTSPLKFPSPPFRLASSSSIAKANTNNSSTNISPALLARARLNAQEHADLTSRLAQTYDSNTAKRAGSLLPVATAYQTYQSARSNLHELNAILSDPDSDQEINSLAEEDLAPTTTRLNAAAQQLTTSLLPEHPFEQLPCLIEIRPGAGGEEAALFAGDLLRMYQAFCSRKNIPSALLKYEDSAGMSDPNGSDAPLHEAILEIKHPGAWGMFRTEAGVHRVQRVPATESKGRTHTSAATVLVLPSFGNDAGAASDQNLDDPSSDFYIHTPDVRVDVMRARGAGGQHVNTTDSAVRLTHTPTAVVVSVQDSRSQLKNRAKAWQILRARLAAQRRDAREQEMLKFRRGQAGHGQTGRGDKVRTYNWGQGRVTDHRCGWSGTLWDVLEGGEGLEEVMERVKDWMVEAEVQSLALDAEMALKRDNGGADGKDGAAAIASG